MLGRTDSVGATRRRPRALMWPLSTLVLSVTVLAYGCSSAGSGGTSALNITTSSLPDGQVGAGYFATLSAEGGQGPLAWSVSAGVLPHGLALNGSTGAITGTPAEVSS